MMNKIYTVSYYGSQNEASSTWFGHCCGAKYVKNPTPVNLKKGYRGIRIAVGEVVPAYKGPKQSIDVINTRNGPLTVGIRHAW